MARETVVATAQQHLPNDWQLQEARGLLGEDLAGQKHFAEAEPLLLSSYDGIKRLEAGIPDGKATRTRAIRRLVDFCTQANRPAEAANWTKELQASQAQ